MIKLTLFILGFITFGFSGEIEQKTVEYDGKTQKIEISNSQINRIVLPYKISSKLTSKEKGLDVSVVDTQAFIKFMPILETTKIAENQTNNQKILNKETKYTAINEAEVYFLTNSGETFSFIFQPRAIPAQTIIVRDIRANAVKSFNEKTTSFQDQISSIVKDVFKTQELKGFKKTKINKIVLDDSRLRIISNFIYESSKYNVYLFDIKNKFKTKGMQIKEIALMPLVKFPIYAISIYYANEIYEIAPNSYAKAIIITAKENI